jgi:hypothetical protein
MTDSAPGMAVAAYFPFDNRDLGNGTIASWAWAMAQWDRVAAAGCAVRLVVADQSYSDFTPAQASSTADTRARFTACRTAGQLVFGYVYAEGGQIPVGPPGTTWTHPTTGTVYRCVGDQIDAWQRLYGAGIDGIYVDVGPTDCNNQGQSPAPANYRAYVNHIRQYGYQVFLLTPLYPDDQPVTAPWLRNLGAEYIALWESGQASYRGGGFHAVNYCDPTWPTTWPSLGVPAWWDPGPSQHFRRVHIINDVQDAATMRTVAELAISDQRAAGTVWITKARPDPVLGSVYDQLPPYWDDEVRFFRDRQLRTWPGSGATLYRDGRLVVFARGSDGLIYHRWQATPNGDWSGSWESIGAPPGCATSDPDATLNLPGGLVAFARGADGAIWHCWQDQMNGNWSGWATLGGVATSGPGATLYRDGRLVVFVRGTDSTIWHRWQTTPNGDWSGWESIGAPPGGATSGPDATLNWPGGLVAFARGGDGAVWHCWQEHMNGDWSGWASLGGIATNGPGATLYRDGRLVVFMRGTDNTIWHCWQTTPNGDWSGWESIGAPPGGAMSDPDATLNQPGGLVAFARGGDGAIWHCWQGQMNGDWSGWATLGAAP